MPASDPGRALRWWAVVLVGFLHGVLTAPAYPPVGWWPLVFLSLLPLIWLALREAQVDPIELPRGWGRRFWRRIRTPVLVAVGAYPLWLYEERWLFAVTAPGYPFGAAIMAAYPGIFVGLLAYVQRRLRWMPAAVTAPVLWLGIEAFRGEILFDGYAWLLVGHPLIDAPFVPLLAATLGTYSVSFLVAVAAGGLAGFLWQRRGARTWSVSAAVACWAMGLFWIWFTVPRPLYGPTLRVAVIQTDLPQSNKLGWSPEEQVRDFERFMDLTRQAAAGKPDLIVWPETMFPGVLDAQAIEEMRRNEIGWRVPETVRAGGLLRAVEFPDRLLALHRDTGIPMVIGAVGYDNLRFDTSTGPLTVKDDGQFNSAFLLAGGNVAARYDKVQLTPFGEIMPYIHHWPWLQQLLLDFGAGGMSFNLSPGRRPLRLELEVGGQRVAIGTPICFEVTDAGVNRDILRAGEPLPSLLLNITNDGWFGSFEGGRQQHMEIARWRAVELGVPMVRAANTGISSAFDHRGRPIKIGIDGGGAAHVAGVMTTEVRTTRPMTPYFRIGNVFAGACLVLPFVLLAAARLLPLAKRPSSAS
jgi:apolipoprotein N-acyltransferase